MISYADKYSQVIVSQTLESESASYEAAKRNPYGEINPNKFLQSIINWKTNITHLDYILWVSPTNVTEDGVSYEIDWGTHIHSVVSSSEKCLVEYVDDELFKVTTPVEGERRFAMRGGFINNSNTNVPSWGSHS
tara:strand:+ start:195 stop:596 length:402 start_codon:yes stop_codon:yes gene_type:complete